MRVYRVNGIVEDILQSGNPLTTFGIEVDNTSIIKLSFGVLLAVAIGVKIGKSI